MKIHTRQSCRRASTYPGPSRRAPEDWDQVRGMPHQLLVVDDRWSSAPKVVAASSIRDC